MQEIVEYERRITAALKRMEAGIAALAAARREEVAAVAAATETAAQDALRAQAAAQEVQAKAEALRAAELAAEAAMASGRDEPTVVRMRERLAEAREREAELRRDYEERIEVMTAQLDSQGLELLRLRRVAETLREELRRQHEAAAAGLADPGLINRAMLAELDALRATRLAELAELEEITAALQAHLQEADHA